MLLTALSLSQQHYQCDNLKKITLVTTSNFKGFSRYRVYNKKGFIIMKKEERKVN